MYSPNEKEIENVSNLEPFERYQYTIKRVADWDAIYIIEEEEDHYLLLEVGNKIVLSIWPALEYAEKCLDVFGGNKVIELDIALFQEEIIAMEPADMLLNVFSIDHRAGFVVTKDEFINDLREELENYE